MFEIAGDAFCWVFFFHFIFLGGGHLNTNLKGGGHSVQYQPHCHFATRKCKLTKYQAFGTTYYGHPVNEN